MTEPKRENSDAKSKPDPTHGRGVAGASYAATEREQTEDIERVARGTDEAEQFVTDAELEAREAASQDDEPTP